MKQNMNIWGVPDQTRLKMKLLCVGRHLSMAELLTEIVEKEWSDDKTIVDKLEKRKLGRIIKKFGLK